MQCSDQVQQKEVQRVQSTNQTLGDDIRMRTGVKRPRVADQEYRSSEKRARAPQTKKCTGCKETDAHCEVEEGSRYVVVIFMYSFFTLSLHFPIYRRCKRCIRGHIKYVFESCTELEKAANQWAKNTGKAKEDGQGKTGEVGDKRGIEALTQQNKLRAGEVRERLNYILVIIPFIYVNIRNKCSGKDWFP